MYCWNERRVLAEVQHNLQDIARFDYQLKRKTRLIQDSSYEKISQFLLKKHLLLIVMVLVYSCIFVTQDEDVPHVVKESNKMNRINVR